MERLLPDVRALSASSDIVIEFKEAVEEDEEEEEEGALIAGCI